MIAAIYARKSLRGNTEAHRRDPQKSVACQVAQALAYAARRRWTVSFRACVRQWRRVIAEGEHAWAFTLL
jgi:hypothetical protein